MKLAKDDKISEIQKDLIFEFAKTGKTHRTKHSLYRSFVELPLNEQQIWEADSDKILVRGFGNITHPYYNQADNVNEDGILTVVKFVAIRGGGEDWALYHSMDANLTFKQYFSGTEHLLSSFKDIANCGQKLHNMKEVQNLFDCDLSAIKLYRH